MLNQHPEIIVPPECGFALYWYAKYENRLVDESYINDFLDDVAQSKKIENWNIDLSKLKKYVQKEQPNSYAELAYLVYKFYGVSQAKNVSIIGDKNNFYTDYLAELKQIYPQSKILFLTRDGRDVACSYKALNESKVKSIYKPILPIEIGDIANEWVHKNQQILDYCSSIDTNQWLHVRFEDLINNPVKTLTTVAEFLGTTYHANMLNYKQDDSEPEDILQWKKKTKENLDTNNINKFKRILTEEEIQIFEDIASDMLSRFNYL
jgi:hypothetical protein